MSPVASERGSGTCCLLSALLHPSEISSLRCDWRRDCLRALILQVQKRLYDYRNRIKVKAEQVVIERFKKLHSDDVDAIQDREKRIKFGTMWCSATGKDYNFIWQGYDKLPVSYANSILSLLT